MASDNKTEKPTPRRRQKAREQGQVARSRELSGALAAIVALLMLSLKVNSFAGSWREFLIRMLQSACEPGFRMDRAFESIPHMTLMPAVLSALSISWAVAVSVSIAQGGIVFASSALTPSLRRISPAAKVAQLFSMTAVRGLLKSLLPGALIVYLAVSSISRDLKQLFLLTTSNVIGVVHFVMSRLFEIAWKSGLVLLGWAIVDYWFEHQRIEGELRMSRQDLVDEFKETEGNPAIKARIRRLQKQVRRRRQIEDVKRASVVITNPTEFAVALEYRPEMGAPVVVAKGRNRLAALIKQVARWHGITVLENPPLAHALYRAVEIGQAIPPKLYAVVAEVLAAVYRAQAQAAQPQGGR